MTETTPSCNGVVDSPPFREAGKFSVPSAFRVRVSRGLAIEMRVTVGRPR